MYKAITLTALLIASNSIWSQCGLEDHMPAFEIYVPEGVTVDSAFLKIENWGSNYMHIESDAKSSNWFRNLSSIYLDWTFNILEQPFSGPDLADYQIISALAGQCRHLGDWLNFDWQVIIHCSGQSGPNLEYSGPYTNFLGAPTQAGSVFEGINVISGTISDTIMGSVFRYRDSDLDGFGSLADSVVLCEYSVCIWYADNSLDCDDSDPSINPAATEIPNDGIDENCDGLDGTTSIHQIADVTINIYPNPATSAIYIDIEKQLNFRASLYDMAGKLIHTSLNPSIIDIQWLPRGQYLLEIEDLRSGDKLIERVVKGN